MYLQKVLSNGGENMGYLVERDSEGRLTYISDTFLTSSEKMAYDNLLIELKECIPKVEEGLKNEYENSLKYKYFLGKYLSNLLEKYNINYSERRLFWDEIKDFASKDIRKRDEGTISKTRSFYEQCYILSQHDIKIAEKLSWRQWQDILDRVSIREDNRVFKWIGKRTEKIRQDDWREFLKALHLYLKRKDTSVFSDDELFEIYDSLLEMSVYWHESFIKFSKENIKSAKIKSRNRRSKKYQKACFELKREKRKPLNKEIFSEAFDVAMK